MELIGAMLSGVYDIFNIEFVLFGFPLSLWQVFIWSIIAGIVLKFIGSVLNG